VTQLLSMLNKHTCSFTAVCSKNICAAHTNFASVFLYQIHENQQLKMPKPQLDYQLALANTSLCI